MSGVEKANTVVKTDSNGEKTEGSVNLLVLIGFDPSHSGDEHSSCDQVGEEWSQDLGVKRDLQQDPKKCNQEPQESSQEASGGSYTSKKQKPEVLPRKIKKRANVKRTFEKVVQTPSDFVQSLEAKKAFAGDTIGIEKARLRLLRLTGYKEELISEYPDLNVDIDETNNKVTIQGPRQQCYEAKAKIFQKVSKFKEKVILSKLIAKNFSAQEVFEKIGTRPTLLCYDNDIYAVYHTDNGIFLVTGIDQNHADQASDFFKSLITEIEIEVNQDDINVNEDELDVFCKKVSQEFKVCVGRNTSFDICIAGIEKDVSCAQKEINKFLEDNSHDNITYCSSDKEMRRYIFEHREEELLKIEKDDSVSISADEEKPDKVLIHGAKMKCASALAAIRCLEASVSTEKMKVQQPCLHRFVASGKLDALITKAERDHKCTIAASHGLFSSASTYHSKKCGNLTISWKQGSIVAEHASILVGSSIGKLFQIFEKARGHEFPKQAEKGDYLRVINETGNLPCNHVILVSCCKWDGEKGEAEKNLRSMVRACLLQAVKLNATSIAFPIIGTGGLGFPHNEASHIMISEVISFTRQLEEASLKDIRFVVLGQDRKLVNAFNQEFTKAFDHASGNSHEASGSSTFSSWRTPPERTKNAFGDVSVEVFHGDLTKEKTDAIVNINAINMNMQEAGMISKAIAAAAGPAVQSECSKFGRQDAGSAVITSAGKLKVKRIIHMIPGEASVQHIQQCIEKCLETADKSRFQSISIPACGTGGFNLSAGNSAQATFQALLKMCSNLKHLKKVRIVIFKPELLPEFKKQLSKYETRIPNDTFGKSGGSKNVDEPTTTSIELTVYGGCKKAVDEAVADITRGLTEACKTKAIEDKNISELSEDQRKVLTENANDLGVEIKFEDDNQRIEFRGNPGDIMEIFEKCWKEIQTVQQDKVIPLPKNWCPMPKKKGKEETVHLVSLSNVSAEYKNVLKMFQKTGGIGQVLKIERIQNPHLYRQYIIRKEKMDKDNGGMKNERQLFHGTAGGNVNDINTRGFNRIFRDSRVGIVYGEGVYFAKNASYSCTYASPDANRNRHMYLALVLVGRYVMGNPQMKVPPGDPKTGTPFDSAADKNDSDASIFVVFYDAQCYPQYLITFQ